MNLSEHKYVNTYDCTLVKYNISAKYTMCRDYKIVDRKDIINDPGVITLFNKNYSYGLLTNIYNSNVFILDIDRVSHRLFYNYKFKNNEINNFVKKYNDIRGGDKIQVAKMQLIINEISNRLGSKLKDVHIYQSSTNGRHVYFILDDYYDVSGLYKSELAKLVACNGYLKFVINSGYSNIRVTNKVLEDNAHINTEIKLINK